MVLASGPADAKIAIIGAWPGDEEFQRGQPFVGPTGTVLLHELAKRGVILKHLRLTNLWHHAETEDSGCFSKHLALTLREVASAEKVLVCGAVCANTFFEQGVSRIAGLWMKSALLPGVKVMATYNPADALKGDLGELALALDRFFENPRLKTTKKVLKQCQEKHLNQLSKLSYPANQWTGL